MDTPLDTAVSRNFLVIAADMATYSGRAIGAYQLVQTCAEHADDALDLATNALEDGCFPLAVFDAEDLQQLAAELTARVLELRESFNVTTAMSDADMAALEAEEETPLP